MGNKRSIDKTPEIEAHLKDICGAGHLISAEKPEEYNRLALDFPGADGIK
jgi:hypothetical protein